MKSIEQVIAERAGELLEIDGVVGVYEGVDADGTPIVRIAVAKRTRRIGKQVPNEIDGYRVEIVVTGPIGPL